MNKVYDFIKKNKWNIVLGVIYCTFMAYIHIMQALENFPSDMPLYLLDIKGVDTGYSFPYPIYFGLARFLACFFSVETASSIVLTLLNGVFIFALVRFSKHRVPHMSDLCVACVVFLMIICSMIFSPAGLFEESDWWCFRYLGVFTPNPYQNATYIATRPFAVLLFDDFLRLEEGERKKANYIKTGAWTLLSIMAKPSYVLVFAPVMGIVVLADWIRTKKFKGHVFYMLLSMIPSIIALVLQYFLVFSSDSSGGGIHIGLFTVWHIWTKGIKLAFFKANLFPIIYIIFHIKEVFRQKLLRYGVYGWIAGIVTFSFLYEGGFRMNDANFAWGYMHGMFFIFSVCILMLFEKFAEKKRSIGNYISLAGLLPHIICGVLFFVFILFGGSVYSF